ncbi:MAG: aminoacyl-tRNA hydrolase [Actinobacteria bacterium]|nr:aminoacyl-tRNA hydrolase [Actinomycetota bacterium]
MSGTAALEARLRQAIARHGKLLFAKSGGPGGQNVNAVSTQVEVRVLVESLPVGPRKRELIRTRLATRVTADGWVRVVSRRERHQRRNRERAIDTLVALLLEAMQEDPRRIASRPTASAMRRRRDSREKTAAKKRTRRQKPPLDD